MDLQDLEQLRKKELFKFLFFNILNTTLIILLGYYFFVLDHESNLMYIPFLLLVLYIFISGIPKKFENKAKKYLMPQILQNFIAQDDNIKWQSSSYEVVDNVEKNGKKDKIIEKLEQSIDKQCTKKTTDDDNKVYCNVLEEVFELELKESLTQEEKDRLQDLNEAIETYNELVAEEYKQRHAIKLKMLEEIEKKTSNCTSEDLQKMEYLKQSIKDMENTMEYDQLNSNINNLTETEKDKLTQLSKIIEKRNKDSDEFFKEQHKQLNIDLCLYDIFFDSCHSMEYDDVFYGKYKNIDFITIECRNTEEHLEKRIFEGTVIKIPLKIKFKNTLFIDNKHTHIFIAGKQKLKTGLSQIKLDNLLDKKYKIWAKSSTNISKILDTKFVQFLNNVPNKFSYVFKNDNAYLIWKHSKDYYKFGSIFKKIDDKKQYENFAKDFMVLLQTIEVFGANSWA